MTQLLQRITLTAIACACLLTLVVVIGWFIASQMPQIHLAGLSWHITWPESSAVVGLITFPWFGSLSMTFFRSPAD